MKSWIDSRPLNGRQWCGDFVECLDLAPHRRAIIVGDVAGRGTDVADGAGALHAHVRGLVINRVPLTTGLRSACDFFTRTVATDAAAFASLFIAVIDLRERVMHYASAGHEPGLLFNGDGTHEHLNPTGPVLGVGAVPVFGERVLRLHRESFLVVVTDGITEARRLEGDQLTFFGTRGVVRAVHNALRQGRDPARAISSAAIEHAHGKLTDDATVLVSSLPPVAALQVVKERSE